MPVSAGCPCGAVVKPGFEDTIELTDDILETLTGSAKWAKYAWLAVGWVGYVLGLRVVCANPQVPMPVFEWADLLNYETGKRKFFELIANKMYETGCDCVDCPPIVTCGSPPSLVIDHSGGYQTDPDDPTHYRFHIPAGAEVFITAPNGNCRGVLNGCWVYWNFTDDTLTDGNVNIRAGDDFAPGYSTDISDFGETITIWYGGPQVPSSTPVPEPDPGWLDYSFPAPCTNSDICASLSLVESAVHRMEFLVNVIAGPLYGITTPISAILPGSNIPISGTLVEVLGRLFEAAAPLQPHQLSAPTVTVVTTPTLVDVTGLAYVNIVPTVIPPRYGHTTVGPTEYYFNKGMESALGYVTVMGQDGALEWMALNYSAGTEFVIPPTATGLAIMLGAGVEVEVHTRTRNV